MGEVITLDEKQFVASCPTCKGLEFYFIVDKPGPMPRLAAVECCECEHRLELDIS